MNPRLQKLIKKHNKTWRNKPETYWFQRLVCEVGELGGSLAGEHKHLPDWELTQIAAICINWLKMREEREEEEKT